MTFTIEDAQSIGEEIGIDWEKVDFTQESFLSGLEVELEHGTEITEEDVNVTDDDPKLTGMIAWAHLIEDPDYYEMLDAMEGEFDGVKTEDLVTSAYDPYSHEWERAYELLRGAESMYVHETVSNYYNRLQNILHGYSRIQEKDMLPGEKRIPPLVKDVAEKARALGSALVQAEDEFLKFMDESGEYPDEDDDGEGGYMMDRAEGATFRTSSILHDGQVYIAKRRYEGPPLETGKTSIKGGAAPAIQWMTKQGIFQPGMKVLDWGAGKVARNADFLRSLGCEVFAYDPFNATGGDGWEMGSVAGEKPDPQQFDVGFSSFVLNVVPEHIEDEILRDMGAYTSEMYHIVRNRDIYKMAENALSGTTNNPHIVEFYLTQFADDEEKEAWEAGKVYEEDIEAFCPFGFKSGPGKFQRIPSDLEDKGYRILKETSGYTIYSNA